MHFCAAVAARTLTYLPSHHCHFYLLLYEKLFKYVASSLNWACPAGFQHPHIYVVLLGSFPPELGKPLQTQAGWTGWGISANQPVTDRSGVLVPQLPSPSNERTKKYVTPFPRDFWWLWAPVIPPWKALHHIPSVGIFFFRCTSPVPPGVFCTLQINSLLFISCSGAALGGAQHKQNVTFSVSLSSMSSFYFLPLGPSSPSHVSL